MRTLRGKYRNRNLTGGTGPIILKKILSKEHRGAVLGFVRAPAFFGLKLFAPTKLRFFNTITTYKVLSEV